jgi:hypothetical protein
VSSVLPAALSDTNAWPGATMSGFAWPSYHAGPRELHGATSSSRREIVSIVMSDPTVIADGAVPGDAMPP